MASEIKFDNICKRIGNRNLLANLSFGVQNNELLFIIGKNDSGKSSLFKILMNMVSIDKGSIFVKGMNYETRKNDILALIGYMPQENNFDENLNINDNLYYHGLYRNISYKKIERKILKWSEILNFRKYLNKYPNQISFEVLRKISFFRSILNDSPILLLDNPTFGMNYYEKRKIWDIINEIKANKTIICISQDFDEVESYADRTIIIQNGECVFNAKLSKIFENISESYRYHFVFKKIVPNSFLKDLKNDKNIYDVISRDVHLEFSTKLKQVFFSKIELASQYDLVDVRYNQSKIKEIFKKITD